MKHSRTKAGGSTTILIGVVVGIVLIVAGIFLLRDISPPLLQGIDLNLGMLAANIGVVLVLVPVINKLYVTPLREAINARTNDLERTFREAEELRSRMDQMRSEYENRLRETESAAREQIQAQIKEAQQLGQRLRAEANARADEMIKRAAEEIESEKQKVMTQLRLDVVNLTLGATERLLGENMDTEKNRRLVEDFIQKVEVAR